jgi:hypothetical protein
MSSFGQYNFDAQQFIKPPLAYGPFTRWWWPGNDVSARELIREVNLFAQNRFAGVEIQPLTVGINPVGKRINIVNTWDTPSFYENVSAVMKAALKTGLTVDMNGGSGWPMGGSFLKQTESLLTLDVADTVVNGGMQLDMPVPVIKSDYSKILRSGRIIYNKTDLSLAKLQTITAARIVKQENGKTQLDSASIQVLDAYLQLGKLVWTVPKGSKWKIMSFYALPDGEKPTYIATGATSWVTDHLDSNAVKKSYQYLFGTRTGLNKYYGKPFRAIFNDSKEFIASRHFSKDFLDYFKQHRKYDIRPWLAVNAITGYNNAYSFGRDTIPVNVFSDEDWRLRYDFNLTISDLYKKHFLNSSRNWMEQRGLQHRTQEYGIRVDIIGASGLASIPEAEQLSFGGSEGFVKLVTSGAHLYNKPVISQETLVFSGGAGMTTPEKIKAYANKSFAAGINQLVYHGSSYKYQTGEYGIEGWSTWSTPFRTFNYGSDMNESNNYWKYIGEINTFIARSQYALRAGKPVADVLVYFPFIDFEPAQMFKNPEETLLSGSFNYTKTTEKSALSISETTNLTFIQQWFKEVWPLLNRLEAMGITWDYVNDESLLKADVVKNLIQIRGNQYKALIVPYAPYMPLESAKQTDILSAKGAQLLVLGNSPVRQPGFSAYQQNDLKVKNYFENILKKTNADQITDLKEFDVWSVNLSRPIRFNQSYDFMRQLQREMVDGSRLHFLWNRTGTPETIALTLDKKYGSSYWLDPENGRIVKNESHQVAFKLQPYSSIILYATVKSAIPAKLLSKRVSVTTATEQVTEIKNWNIKAGSQLLQNRALFDWRSNDGFKYLSAVGTYIASFSINPQKNKLYTLALGNVYFSAEVYINEKFVGKRIWPPYTLDVSGFIKQGTNTIKVLVTPSDRNFFVGQGAKGDPKYSQYKNLEKTLLPAGLLGPVVISESTLPSQSN